MLVIDNVSRKVETLRGVRERLIKQGTSHSSREAAACEAGAEALEYHAAHVEQERAALPLLCALVDALRQGHAVRDIASAAEAKEALERAFERAAPYVDDNR